MLSLLASLVALALASLIGWLAWNNIAPVYLASLPKHWQHLDFWTTFCILWIVRVLSSVMRSTFCGDCMARSYQLSKKETE